MKVLMIEDNKDAIIGLIDELSDRKWENEVATFENAEERIYCFDPDVIVMDWMYDAEDAEKGKPILERIIANEFRPVIVFSAHDLTHVLQDIRSKYPLIDYTRKGDDDSKLALTIDKWKDSAISISKMRHSMNLALVESARVLPTFQDIDPFPAQEIVSFMMSRRTIQFFEQKEVGDRPPTWVQYVYPPMNDHLFVADIIRVYSKDTDQNKPGKPEEYFVILTPSCDMVNCKDCTLKVLVAKCVDKIKVTEQRLGSNAIDSLKGKDKVERVAKELRYGYNKSYVALPELPNIMPYMTIDLKDLDFLQLSEIALSLDRIEEDKHKYYRVTSIASPFREQVVWAHMINSCRPGMPERDADSWAKGILG